MRSLYDGKVRHKQGAHDYYYDIWSNIHYGYVGMASGLSESLLLDGAGAEQIVSDSWRKVKELALVAQEDRKLPGPHRSVGVIGLRAWDDAPDRISIGIGTKLYSRYPNGRITATMIKNEVLAVTPKNWGEGASVHDCKTN
ncbi:polymorphic toxin type 44 domain-containing protein [Rhodococcus sp. IEGM1300]